MKPTTVREYLAAQPKEQRQSLKKLRKVIQKTAPEAEEYISYGMPGYRKNGMLCWFAAFSNHYSLFVKPVVMKHFREELESFKTTKSAIHFNYGNPLPVRLVAGIIKHALNTNKEKNGK
ncbi:MAG TPA: DUF1801 domain-containing protein [Ignavibacteria bacterium]|nr:DUF1801 domain-containing protein [Ignavibacteria bacterium]